MVEVLVRCAQHSVCKSMTELLPFNYNTLFDGKAKNEAEEFLIPCLHKRFGR